MGSGRLLLLLGLLTLWAELLPASSLHPDFCFLPADAGPCKAKMPRFFYDSASGECRKFVYGGCKGNANNFKTLKQCHLTCVEKPGLCPKAPPDTVTICLAKCERDSQCPGRQKCCNYACLRQCMDPK